MSAHTITVNDVLDGHVALDIQCLDRIYLNAYVPILQTSAQVVAFLTHHLGYPVPSPALFNRIGQQFRRAVTSFAQANDIPWVKFGKNDVGGKLELMRPHLTRQAATGHSGVAAIGVAQEFQRVWTAYERTTSTGTPAWSFVKADRRVSVYYFYLWDIDFGPAFIKVCSYFPYPAKIWLNGHEWAKQQATAAGIGFTELSNGFAATDDPVVLQAICDRLGPGVINVFVQRWLSRLPLPFQSKDRDAGYWWETSMRQIETSRTIVFDAPRHARGFFEALITDNLDLGRPHNIEIIFARRVRRDTQGTFRTAIDRRDNGGVILNVFYKHSRIKQYLKDGRAMRIETVINAPRDLGCNARLPNLDQLQAKARAANHRILDTERVGQGCVLASPAFERIAHPSVTADGRRTPALRFGDPRVMALVGALCSTLLAATGFIAVNLICGLTSAPAPEVVDHARQLMHDRRIAASLRLSMRYSLRQLDGLDPLRAARDDEQNPPAIRRTAANWLREYDVADRAVGARTLYAIATDPMYRSALRWRAAQDLTRFGERGRTLGADILQTIMTDEALPLMARLHAAGALGVARPDLRSGITRFLHSLMSVSTPRQRLRALETIGRFKPIEAVQALQDLAFDHTATASVRLRAAHAMADLHRDYREPAAVVARAVMLDQTVQRHIRIKAARALSRWSDLCRAEAHSMLMSLG